MRKAAYSMGRSNASFGKGEGFEKKEDISDRGHHWENAGGGGNKNAGFNGQDHAENLTATSTPIEVYSEEAIAELVFMMEEEKLAGDIYDAFYATYGVKIFENIGASEDTHFEAISDYAAKIGLDVDTFVFQPVGEFENPELQELYNTLLAQGMESLTGALEVGVAIENKDIVDIAAAAEAVEGTPLADIYGNLLNGSYNHLDAFEALLA